MNKANLQKGMTLIEVLLAVAIASLVIVLLFVTYRTAMTVVESQRHRINTEVDADDVLDKLIDDLMRLYVVQEGMYPSFELTQDSSMDDDITLSFYTMRPDDVLPELKWSDVMYMSYQLRHDHDHIYLQQTFTPLLGTQAGVTITNRLLEGIQAMTIESYDGETWVPEYSATDEQQIPEKIKISIDMQHSQRQTPLIAEILIPAGHRVKSQLARQLEDAVD